MNCDTLIKNNKYNAKDLLRRTTHTNNRHNLPPLLNAVHLKASKRRLVAQTTSVLHTNGVDEMLEDCEVNGSSSALLPKYQMFVPWLGTAAERRHLFEISDNIMIDIDGESTRLPIFCHVLHVNEGGTTSKKTSKRLMRDAGVQFGASMLPSRNGSLEPSVFNVWASDNEYYSTHYYFKNWRINRDLFMKYNKSVQVNDFEFAVMRATAAVAAPTARSPPRSRDASPCKQQQQQPVVESQVLLNQPLSAYSSPLFVVPPSAAQSADTSVLTGRSGASLTTPRSTPLTPILKSTPTQQPAAPQVCSFKNG
jgi:hypothetical protein